MSYMIIMMTSSPVNSPHKGQWRGALMFSFIRAWINGWVNNSDAGDLRHHRAYYDVIVMCPIQSYLHNTSHEICTLLATDPVCISLVLPYFTRILQGYFPGTRNCTITPVPVKQP